METTSIYFHVNFSIILDELWYWGGGGLYAGAGAWIWSFNLNLVPNLRISGAISPLTCRQLYLLPRRFRVTCSTVLVVACNKVCEECGHPCYGCLVHWTKSWTKDVAVSDCGSRRGGNLLSLWMGEGQKKRIIIQREGIILSSLPTAVKFVNGQHSILRSPGLMVTEGWRGAPGWRRLGRVTKGTHMFKLLTYLLTCGRCVRLTTLPPSCAVVTKSGSLNFLEPSGHLGPVMGLIYPFFYLLHCAESFLRS